MGRPKSAVTRSSVVQVRFTEDERRLLDRLVDAVNAEALDVGAGDVTASSVIRSLVVKAARSRGLDKTNAPEPGNEAGMKAPAKKSAKRRA